MSNVELEKVFAGEDTTWGQVFPWIAGNGQPNAAACAATPIKRVVRVDSSGTTFALKQFLASINPTRGWAGLDNTAWPNNAGGTAVVRASGPTGGALRSTPDNAANAASIRPVGLATAPRPHHRHLLDPPTPHRVLPPL